jgi:hypothetical protein
LIGDGKSDIGSLADCTLKNSPHLNTYRRCQMTAIPFDFNPISDRAEFFRLTRNLNLSNLDLEGSLVSYEAESLLMAVSILPQLTILNRKIISSDDRRKPGRRFCHSLSQYPQQCSAEVAALQLQNETFVAQQRVEIASVRSDCEARKQRWKSEVHELRSKICSLQAEMQTKGESTRDDNR